MAAIAIEVSIRRRRNISTKAAAQTVGTGDIMTGTETTEATGMPIAAMIMGVVDMDMDGTMIATAT